MALTQCMVANVFPTEWVLHLFSASMWLWHFFSIFLEDINHFCWATDTLVLDLWWCLSQVSKPEWILHLCPLLPVCNKFLRFSTGVTPTDLLAASMTAKLFHPCTYIPALVTNSKAVAYLIVEQNKTVALPTELSRFGNVIVTLITWQSSVSW